MTVNVAGPCQLDSQKLLGNDRGERTELVPNQFLQMFLQRQTQAQLLPQNKAVPVDQGVHVRKDPMMLAQVALTQQVVL